MGDDDAALIGALLAIPTAGGLGEDWQRRVERHRGMIRQRSRDRRFLGVALAGEEIPPTGQAGLWYDDVAYQSPRSARSTARQIARLCGEDSTVTTTWRSLADSVGERDRMGREVAYVQSGAEWLRHGGWLEWEAIGSRRSASTTFQLLPGNFNWRGSRVDDLYASPSGRLMYRYR